MAERQAEQVISEQIEHLQSMASVPHVEPAGRRLLLAGLLALGVVFGDIGTSPLYALRGSFIGSNAVPPTPMNVLGVLSLILWSLVIVISIKYLLYVMRADNRGEGGILALLALLLPWRAMSKGDRRLLFILGIFGAALLYGDGIITPAISVLSAVEGLGLATPVLDPYVMPITVLILILLFVFQHRGTASVGSVFGPVMLIWFLTIAALGIVSIMRWPEVLAAANPVFGIRFFLDNGWRGFLTLGAVFLVVTGGEALYADMGHFGRRPIRLAWFALVLPALLLNYFGQGAVLLGNPQYTAQPFFLIAPRWALLPLVILATTATIIASQAVISGVFSLTRQAVLLGYLPRLVIVQTSSEEIGQVYIPNVNWMLMIATIALVISFRQSSNLTAAYGVAISTTMVITTMLAYVIARERWGWSPLVTGLATLVFLAIDLTFFGANLVKIVEGGWVPLLVAVLVYTLMSTWKQGRAILSQRKMENTRPLGDLIAKTAQNGTMRVPGTAVFLTAHGEITPPILLQQLKHNQVLHQQVVLLTVVIENMPRVPPGRRVEVTRLDQGFFRVIVHFGFMENTNVPRALRTCKRFGLHVDMDSVTYFVGRDTPISTDEPSGMTTWQERLFAFMVRNSADLAGFYHLPSERVIELGIRVEL
jgi:KUP system potassium uptake protein